VIDLALYSALLPALSRIPIEYRLKGDVWRREGNRHRDIVGNTYETADGHWLQVVVAAPGAFERLAAAMGRPDLPDDPRYRTAQDRADHLDELDALVAAWVASLPASEAEQALADASVASTLINSIEDLLEHPHVRARGDFTELDTPAYGPLPVPTPSPRLSRTPGGFRAPGPRAGEHTAEVLGRLLGLSPADLSALREQGVV
jgi:succinyl-CoA--D-citramalate CoA-transferase